MMHCQYCSYTLNFAFNALTSRGALSKKKTWFLKIWYDESPETVGYGEVALFPGLSEEYSESFERVVRQFCEIVNQGTCMLSDIPSSIWFALESAIMDYDNRQQNYSADNWISGKEPNQINGLIWMGDMDTMQQRIDAKLEEGYQCLKLKIGGIDFDSECELLKKIRDRYSMDTLMVRLDANGAFTPENAMERLERLSQYDIHSIEQPIRRGQWEQMSRLCKNTPIAIALDEELIGMSSQEHKEQMLSELAPQYIVLKPSLCGGIYEAKKWLEVARKKSIDAWFTSALESNVGLRAIAQVAYEQQAQYDMWMPQGLGTGEVFTNNIPSGLYREGQQLWHDPTKEICLDGLDLRWREP